MSNKENRCISYIYNEMDPSERLEFERDLESDENLLIEVETLKKISGNLKKPELICPPDYVVERIRQQASQKRDTRVTKSRNAVWLVAASVLIVAAFGFYAIETGTNGSQSSENMAGQSDWNLSEQQEEYGQVQVANSNEGVPSPWVDNNDILHFNDRFNSANVAHIDSLINTSFKKLTPVTVPSKISSMQQQLHLTGSN